MTIDGVLLDLAGCVYEGDRLVPGAAEALGRLREAGLGVRYITNTTRSTKAQLLDKLAALGLAVDSKELFTPVEAANVWLAENAREPVLLVHPAIERSFQAPHDTDGRVVVVSDAGEAFTYANLNCAFRAVMDGAPMLALAKNRFFKDVDGALSLDAGPFVQALEFASGQEAVVLGKPSRHFFDLALKGMGCAADNTVMVGDDAEADIAGALTAGLGAALLVRTGKYRSGAETLHTPAPTATVTDLPAAVEWIMERSG